MSNFCLGSEASTNYEDSSSNFPSMYGPGPVLQALLTQVMRLSFACISLVQDRKPPRRWQSCRTIRKVLYGPSVIGSVFNVSESRFQGQFSENHHKFLPQAQRMLQIISRSSFCFRKLEIRTWFRYYCTRFIFIRFVWLAPATIRRDAWARTSALPSVEMPKNPVSYWTEEAGRRLTFFCKFSPTFFSGIYLTFKWNQVVRRNFRHYKKYPIFGIGIWWSSIM